MFPNNDKIYLRDIRTLYEHKKVIKLVLERIGCCQDDRQANAISERLIQ